MIPVPIGDIPKGEWVHVEAYRNKHWIIWIDGERIEGREEEKVDGVGDR